MKDKLTSGDSHLDAACGSEAGQSRGSDRQLQLRQ